MRIPMKKFRVALVGLGTVGSGVYKILTHKAGLVKRRAGIAVELAAACDQDRRAFRRLTVPKKQTVLQYKKLLADSQIDCIVELIGGKGVARTLILDALKKGKDVVTANKALLAEHGDELFAAAKKYGRQIYFEASVGGGIPIIKTLRESLVGNRITSIFSIINGTANYILSKMTAEKMGFHDALRLAQEKGYAEADPTFDVEGTDSAHKIAIMAQLAFEKRFSLKDIPCNGISRIQPCDIAFADEVGYVIKLLAIAKQTKEGVEVRVQPTLLHKDHILANVHGSFNAVHVHGDETGDMLLYGRGAGSRPTASAVVSDIVDLAKETHSAVPRLPYPLFEPIAPKKLINIKSRYYLRFSAIDKPGVLATIATALGRESISISDVMQRERQAGKVVPVVVLTHEAHEKDLWHAIRRIDRFATIKEKTQVLRIEE